MVMKKLPTVNDYQRIEQAIAYLKVHFREQPAVADVAADVGLSVSQFHRVFQRWAGITPKRFLEYVTAAHARRLLERSASVLESAWDSGLSGAARLHDLFVSTGGVTPGEIGQWGQGMMMRYGVHSSPFGACLVAETDRGVNRLVFIGDADLEAAVAGLHRDWPKARLVRDESATAATMQRIVATLYDAETERPRLMVRGTNFQIRVWEALLRIPSGHVFSYQQLAERAGRPHAVRAVGSAVGANPVPLLIPCHRVIRKTGAFGDYSGGVYRKRAILAWEAGMNEAVD